MFFEDAAHHAELSTLRSLQCPACPASKRPVFSTQKQLLEHVTAKHGKSYCTLCVESRQQVYIGEHPLYNKAEMKVHRQEGVRGKDPAAFKGHASCGLCGGRWFYDTSALFQHNTKEHEACHICDKLRESGEITGERQYFKAANPTQP